ncbi:MAG: hypothetical protein NZ960_05840 [Candidatus Kapabacteria bacterium]|nr:hypothetical protein [Candidatus Kapabacteria bacterium]MDW8012498.1 hypothetical protein [Bacteroidota bacterium]
MWYVAMLAALVVAAASAQTIQVGLMLPFANNMPPRLSEWIENEQLIQVVVRNTDQRRGYDNLVISFQIFRNDRVVARSRDGHPAQPRFSLGPGEGRVMKWREVVHLKAVEYDEGLSSQALATGELPEGEYRLCIRALQLIGPGVESNTDCRHFAVRSPDPPRLLSPIGGAQVFPMPLLQWTPSNPVRPGVIYRVTLKVRYRGQTPTQAMQSNPIRLQVDVQATSYQIPVHQQLGVDATDPNYAGHVWQVQALLNGRPYGRNQGRSQIEWFTVPAMAVDPVKPGGPVVVWELDYGELLSGRVAKLEVTLPENAPDTLTYVVRARIPERLSWERVQQLLGQGASADTLRVSGVYRGGYFVYGGRPQDTSRTEEWERRQPYRGGYFVFGGRPQDTSRTEEWERRRPYLSGYFVYSIPQDTTQPITLQGYYAKNWAHEVRKEISARSRDDRESGQGLRQSPVRGRIERGRIKLNEPVDIVGLRSAPSFTPPVVVEPEGPIGCFPQGNGVQLGGVLIPDHIALPELVLELGEGEEPVCELPPVHDETTVTYAWMTTARQTGPRSWWARLKKWWEERNKPTLSPPGVVR